MIDAASGAIYVIGGASTGGGTFTRYKDVWVSTNGGAQPDSIGVVGGDTKGVLRSTWGALRGTKGELRGTTGGTTGGTWGYSWVLRSI